MTEAPPASAALQDYGEAFPAWLDRFPPAEALPYLAGVAHLDRLWTEALFAAEAPTLSAEALAGLAPQALAESYKLTEIPAREEGENDTAWGDRLLQAAAARRGMRISGNELDTERMARVLLDEYRGGRLGRFTLEAPPAAVEEK